MFFFLKGVLVSKTLREKRSQNTHVSQWECFQTPAHRNEPHIKSCASMSGSCVWNLEALIQTSLEKFPKNEKYSHKTRKTKPKKTQAPWTLIQHTKMQGLCAFSLTPYTVSEKPPKSKNTWHTHTLPAAAWRRWIMSVLEERGEATQCVW